MKSLPLISVRGVVIFPGSTTTLILGRPFTLASVKDALTKFDGQIIITSQRMIEMNDLPDMNQIFSVGCICKILNKVEFPDGSMKILIQAQDRFQIQTLEDINQVRYGAGDILPSYAQSLSALQKEPLLQNIESRKKEWPKEYTSGLEALQSTSNAFDFVMRMGHLLTMKSVIERELTLEQIKEGIFMVDTLTDTEKQKINLNIARVQEVLTSDDTKASLKKIEALLLTK